MQQWSRSLLEIVSVLFLIQYCQFANTHINPQKFRADVTKISNFMTVSTLSILIVLLLLSEGSEQYDNIILSMFNKRPQK
jgi:hypothetical protein